MITHNGGFNRRARTDSTQLYSVDRIRAFHSKNGKSSLEDRPWKVVRLLMGSLSQYCEGGCYSRGGNDDRRLVIVLSYLSLYLESYYNGK